VEENENIEDAVKRECKEEAGCDVEIVKEAGFVTEYRKKGNLKQTSYYYIVKVVGKKGTPNLTEDEIAEGYEIVWVPFETALEKVKANNATFYSAPYIKARDLGALKTLGKK
jgi:8-oxo-dGTP pyrophosphatase MutT (NUDIX family)